MERIVYRLAAAGDIESLVNLRLAFLAEVNTPPAIVPSLGDDLLRYFMDSISSGEFVAYLAVRDSQVIASSGMVYHRHPPSNAYNGSEAYIMNMYTHPEWRGRGISTKLLHLLIEQAREHCCGRVSLHFHPQGKTIYARAGFVPIETEMRLDLVR
jgi:GNAT superfamily N-acetyltransferase